MITIYTDGACKENKRQDGNAVGTGGWAFVILDEIDQSDDMGIVMSGSSGVIGTTNQEMEILAVAEAIESLKSYDYLGKKINLYSDSAYVINCLNDKWYIKWNSNGWKNSKGNPVENRDAWERVLKAIEGIPITFYHVRRNTTKYNKVVDEMAKEASKIDTSQE
jgi:ribonuclease HI